MQTQKKWIHRRHAFVMTLLRATLGRYSRWKYGITVERMPREKQKQCLILYNHQTAFDQFFVGMAVHGPVYYLATEDLFSNGFVSSLIRYLVAPIPIKKQTFDMSAVRNCVRVAREGGTIAIAPEGNRTYSGKTEYISPAIVTFARMLKLPVAFLRIEGGYGAQPRWSDVVRRGKMRAFISRVLEPEEYAGLSNDEFNELICKELYVNEAVRDSEFIHSRQAEYLERAMYVCPDCGLSVFESRRDVVRCTRCGRQLRYLPTKELEGIGAEFPFKFVNDWYEYQKAFINRLDVNEYADKPMYTDTADIYNVEVYRKKTRLFAQAGMTLYGNRIVFNEKQADERVLPFDEVTTISVLGRNKLNIYHGENIYQVKGDKRFNALKYVNIYHRYKNLARGEGNGEFLGL